MNIGINKAIKIIAFIVAFHNGAVIAHNKPNFNSLKIAYKELNLPAVEIDFEKVIHTQTSQKELVKQHIALNKVLSSSHNLKTKNTCEMLEYEKIKFDLHLHITRLKLLKQLSDKTEYSGSIYDLDHGKQWYQLLTLWWLGEDINPQDLKTIGENEFKLAHKQLTQVNKIGEDKTTSSQQSKIIEEAYQQAEKIIMENMKKLFPVEWTFKPITIEKSDLGESFPAPGYYNLGSEKFFYNPLGKDYNLAQIDWLFIHEAIPGHHYQNKIVENYGICNQQLSTQAEMAFSEGWAAYAETLGKELGLFQDPNSYYFALKWKALRAMRVIIDVGIHTQGWTVKQAESYWLSHFPEGKDVMDREIKRIQRWPMQVNTYVYGKYKIEKLKAQLKQRQGNKFSEIQFHKNITSLTKLPLVSINHYHQIFTKN